MFPILSATPAPGEEDPEDEESDDGDEDSERPKHFAAQVCTLVFARFQTFVFGRF